jgi:hypothetical protein
MNIDKSFDTLLFLAELNANPGLKGLWEHIVANNPSGHLRYHNNNHMLGVAMIASKLFVASGGNTVLSTYTTLIQAALLHDVAHSGGKTDDAKNIKQALLFIDTIRSNSSEQWSMCLDANRNRIKELIKLTQFPFIHEPTTIAGKVLRDADLLYTISNDTGSIVFNGLRKEMEVSWGREISYQEMLEGQEKFLKACTLYTEPGKKIWDTLLPIVLKRQRTFVEEAVSHAG